MRMADDSGKGPAVRGLIAATPPLTYTAPAHEPITADLGDATVRVASVILQATKLAHHILNVAKKFADHQAAVLYAEAQAEDWVRCGDELRLLADDLPVEVVALVPALRLGADICDARGERADGTIVPGEAV